MTISGDQIETGEGSDIFCGTHTDYRIKDEGGLGAEEEDQILDSRDQNKDKVEADDILSSYVQGQETTDEREK